MKQIALTSASTIHMDVMGERGQPDVVLLHGCPTPPTHMEGLARTLAQTHRVFLVHLPGYGESPPPAESYSMDDAAEWLEEGLLERGVKEAALVGYSAGAYRALHLVVRRRLRWTGVVAMGGFGCLSNEQKEAYFHFAGELRKGLDLTEVLVNLILAPSVHDPSPGLVKEVESWMKATPAEALAKELLALADGMDLLPMLRDADIPALVLVGELDPVQPPPVSEAISRALPRGEFQALEGLGHVLLLEDPSKIARLVGGFLEKLRA